MALESVRTGETGGFAPALRDAEAGLVGTRWNVSLTALSGDVQFRAPATGPEFAAEARRTPMVPSPRPAVVVILESVNDVEVSSFHTRLAAVAFLGRRVEQRPDCTRASIAENGFIVYVAERTDHGWFFP